MIPTAIHKVPAIFAGRLKFSQTKQQIENPSSGQRRFIHVLGFRGERK
jgi:hypothetical protein